MRRLKTLGVALVVIATWILSIAAGVDQPGGIVSDEVAANVIGGNNCYQLSVRGYCVGSHDHPMKGAEMCPGGAYFELDTNQSGIYKRVLLQTCATPCSVTCEEVSLTIGYEYCQPSNP